MGVVGTPGDKAVNRRGFMRTLAAFSLAPAAKMKAAETGLVLTYAKLDEAYVRIAAAANDRFDLKDGKLIPIARWSAQVDEMLIQGDDGTVSINPEYVTAPLEQSIVFFKDVSWPL